jgi:hypothetical protein
MKFLTLLLTLVALSIGANTASAQNGKSAKFDVCGDYYNPCCDELVSFCLSYNIVTTKNGSNLSVHGSGTGSNGNEYVVSGKNNQKVNIAEDGSGTYGFTQSENWVSKGNPDCHFTFHYTIRYSVDAMGNVTATVENVRITCANSEIG